MGIPLTLIYTAVLSATYFAKFAVGLKPTDILKIQIKAMIDGFRVA